MSAYEVVRLYWKTFKAMEEMALDLKDLGLTEDEVVLRYEDYRAGWGAAREEYLAIEYDGR